MLKTAGMFWLELCLFSVPVLFHCSLSDKNSQTKENKPLVLGGLPLVVHMCMILAMVSHRLQIELSRHDTLTQLRETINQ